MKEVAIVTYSTWTSYGSLLQSYALKWFLKEKFELNSEILLDNKNNNQYKTKSNRINLKSFTRDCIEKIITRNKKKQIYCKNIAFASDFLEYVEFSNYEELKNDLSTYKLYLAGSDQIFHPDLCKSLFFLDFVSQDCVRASYAASMGKTSIREDRINEFSRLVKNFDFLSVREKDNAPVIGKFYNGNIDIHIDPTFLVEKEDWKKIEKPYSISGKYILVYPLFWDTKYNHQLAELEKEAGIKIVTIATGLTRAYGKKLYDVGVEEFLWLIDHAEAVVTSSFHGVALSTIFNKKIAVIVNPDSPSRITCLKELLDLKTLDIKDLISGSMDYSHVNDRIKEERTRSYDYLNTVINYEK